MTSSPGGAGSHPVSLALAVPVAPLGLLVHLGAGSGHWDPLPLLSWANKGLKERSQSPWVKVPGVLES